MYKTNELIDLPYVLRRRPFAVADVFGDREHIEIGGTVKFYKVPRGVLVYAEIFGLPDPKEEYKRPVFGFHMHSGAECSSRGGEAFFETMGHYNPENYPHPRHAGDFPPLFGNGGYALSVFITNRFTPEEIIGKTVVIHSSYDDFSTQPAGNSGKKIACGEIRAVFGSLKFKL